MNPTQSIFRNSFVFFFFVLAFAIWGFWVTYFTRPPETVVALEHVHGMSMFAWGALLVIQAFLIRGGYRPLHRALGKVSFVLVPVIIVSTIMLANYKLKVRGLTAEGVYILSLQVFLIIVFTVGYVGAMLNRGKPDVHARFMICTALTMLDPIFARILLVNFLQEPITTGLAQLITFGFTNLILLWLVWRDWKGQKRKDVFLPMLFVFLAAQIPVFFVIESAVWNRFAEWFMALPLS